MSFSVDFSAKQGEVVKEKWFSASNRNSMTKQGQIVHNAKLLTHIKERSRRTSYKWKNRQISDKLIHRMQDWHTGKYKEIGENSVIH